MNIPDTPFTILVLGPFAPLSRSARAFPVPTVRDALEGLSPEMWAPVAKELCPEGGVLLKPGKMKDFTPDGMVEAVPYLKTLFDATALIDDASGRGVAPAETAGLLRERLPGLSLDLSWRAPSPPRKEAHGAVDDILSMVAMPEGGAAQALPEESGPRAWKRQILSILSSVMEEIFADEGFRSWEAAWRGLETIAKQGPAGEGKGARLIIASVTHETLPAVLDALAETLAQDPPGLILVDLPFDNSQVHVEAMERIAGFASTLLAPAAVRLTERFFYIEDWDGLSGLPYLGTYTDDAAYAKWKNLRSAPEAQWLIAMCNRFLARFPYGEELKPRTVEFRERFLPWVSPVFALGTLAAQSVEEFGAPYRLTDSEHIRLTDCGLAGSGSGVRSATEALIPVDRMRQLAQIGITPLMGAVMKDMASMPLANTVAGESLPFRLFFSCLIGFLIRLKEASGPSPEEGVDAHVKEALKLFYSRAGQRPPTDLEVGAGEPTEQGFVPLEIAFTPPAGMLPDSRRLTFQFMW